MKTKHTSNQNKQVKTGNSGLQNRSEQLGSETQNKNHNGNTENKPKLIPVDFNLRRANRELPTNKVLNLLEDEAPDFFRMAEVVGKWIWIQFKEKQPREVTAILSQLGFHWNNTRQAWQHPCGQQMKEPASYYPRKRYGSTFPADMKAA